MKYIDIIVTVFPQDSFKHSYANFYLSDWSVNWSVTVPMPVKDGFKKLREFAMQLGVKPQLEFNQFDNGIRTWEVHGTIDA